jgi:hypothetical protein
MADKLDFSKLKKTRKPTAERKPVSKKVYKEVEQVGAGGETASSTSFAPASAPQKEAPAKKATGRNKTTKSGTVGRVTLDAPESAGRGRRTWKKEGVKYRRIAFDTPVETQRKLKELLVTKFFDTISYQDELINLAVDEFIRKHG